MATKNPTMMAGAEVPATLSGLRQPMAIAMAVGGAAVTPGSKSYVSREREAKGTRDGQSTID